MPLLSILLFASVGGALFVLLMNRAVLFLRQGPFKTALSLALLILLPACGAAIGYRLAGSGWIWLTVVFWAGMTVWECFRLLKRHTHRGTRPVETDGPRRSLLRPFTTRDLISRRYEVPGVSRGGRRLRVAHLSDFHCHRGLPRDFYAQALDRAAAAEPDLIFLTGDFVVGTESVPILRDVMSHARSRLGTFASLGNHDFWDGEQEIAAGLEAAGITVLGNGWQRVDIGSGTAVVSGCQEPWSNDTWQLPEMRPDEPLFVLSHTADNIRRLARAGASAVFSGHYHAGQGQVPGFGPLLIPSHYGRLYDHGHFRVDGTHLFVTAGVGSGNPPLRIYCRPELLIIDFV